MCRLRLEAFEQNKRLARTYDVAVSDQKLRDDPTFEVLNGLPIAIRTDDAGRNRSAGQRHERSPADETKHKEDHDSKAEA